MNSRLIINADDFGLTRGVNDAIGELFQSGALTSATLMANSNALVHAAAMAKEIPGLGVGCHVVLVDGIPLSAPEKIRSLLGPDGRRFRSSLGAFARAALLGRLNPSEIEGEVSAQLERLFTLGITPTHLDSHKHTHMFPAIQRPLLRVAARFNIPAVRNPFEQAWSLRIGRTRPLRRIQVRLLGLLRRSFKKQMSAYAGRIWTTDGAIGVAATGDLDATTLAALIKALPAGTWELVCHPAYCDAELKGVATRLQEHRNVERLALMNVVQKAVRARHVELISFTALQSGPAVMEGPPRRLGKR